MADVRPFPAVRYDAKAVNLAKALCPPYDVIGAEQARRLRRSKVNAIHLELPLGRGATKYGNAAKTWKRWFAEGLIAQDMGPSYYVFEDRFEEDGRGRRRLGFFAALGVRGDSVLRHERTLPKPKADRLRLLKAVRANVSPIFGLFPDRGGVVRRELERAAARPSDAGAPGRRLWRITDDKTVRVISRALRGTKVLIADGHHRFEVGRAFSREGGPDTVLAYLCPEEDRGLVVHPTHRVVRRAGLLEEARVCCRVERRPSLKALLGALERTPNRYAFGLYEGGRFWLGLPRGAQGCRSGMSVEWLSRRLLARTPPDQISYFHDAAQSVREARSIGGSAVLVKPFPVAQIRRAVETVGLLPPKSTYFFPKVPTGLVFKRAEP